MGASHPLRHLLHSHCTTSSTFGHYPRSNIAPAGSSRFRKNALFLCIGNLGMEAFAKTGLNESNAAMEPRVCEF